MAIDKSIFSDDELGLIYVNPSSRCKKHITMRVIAEGVKVICPVFSTLQEIKNIIEKNKTYLLKCKQQKVNEATFVDASFGINTDMFTLCLKPIASKNFQIHAEIGSAILYYPSNETFAPERQEWLKKAITQALRVEAKLFLPILLHDLAQKHGFTYTGVTIKDNHSNWGSCSNKKHINLSLYLMLLPKRLVEYVLVHELCHTIEMNHSVRFWTLVDKCLGCNSMALRKELKQFHTVI